MRVARTVVVGALCALACACTLVYSGYGGRFGAAVDGGVGGDAGPFAQADADITHLAVTQTGLFVAAGGTVGRVALDGAPEPPFASCPAGQQVAALASDGVNELVWACSPDGGPAAIFAAAADASATNLREAGSANTDRPLVATNGDVVAWSLQGPKGCLDCVIVQSRGPGDSGPWDFDYPSADASTAYPPYAVGLVVDAQGNIVAQLTTDGVTVYAAPGSSPRCNPNPVGGGNAPGGLALGASGALYVLAPDQQKAVSGTVEEANSECARPVPDVEGGAGAQTGVGLAGGDTAVCWAGPDSEIWCKPLDGGPTAPVGAPPKGSTALATRGRYVYAASANQVYRFPGP